jgi:hypothetical protein
MHHAFLTLFATASWLCAQQLTAHPQETLQNGNGNLVPFGVLSTGQFGEGHSQILIPAYELPPEPALLLGLEVHCQATASVTYAALDMTLAPTQATALSMSFASNLVAGPQSVLSATNLNVAYSSNAFVPFPFTTPYVHDGVSSLVIDIQKQVQAAASYPFLTMSTSSSPSRNDRPAMIYAFGTVGSGASTATSAAVAATSLVLRLQWASVATLRNRSDVGPSGNQYGLGSTVRFTVDGPANGYFAVAVALGFLPAPQSVPGVAGALLLSGPVVAGSGLLDGAGSGTQMLSLPTLSAFVGYKLCYQGCVIDLANNGVRLTNGTDHFLNL